eukprot:1276040-Alexandrium_andersonii.AAC.1
MSASLVGSEMCIRDSPQTSPDTLRTQIPIHPRHPQSTPRVRIRFRLYAFLDSGSGKDRLGAEELGVRGWVARWMGDWVSLDSFAGWLDRGLVGWVDGLVTGWAA